MGFLSMLSHSMAHLEVSAFRVCKDPFFPYAWHFDLLFVSYIVSKAAKS